MAHHLAALIIIIGAVVERLLLGSESDIIPLVKKLVKNSEPQLPHFEQEDSFIFIQFLIYLGKIFPGPEV